MIRRCDLVAVVLICIFYYCNLRTISIKLLLLLLLLLLLVQITTESRILGVSHLSFCGSF